MGKSCPCLFERGIPPTGRRLASAVATVQVMSGAGADTTRFLNATRLDYGAIFVGRVKLEEKDLEARF